MKYLPTDISSFNTMINRNYIYVDKTDIIYDLFSGGSRYYFLARPRRFGKTLLISTIKELFLGNKELFKDLKISKMDYGFKAHPVIHLDFSAISNLNEEELKKEIIIHLRSIAQDYDIQLHHNELLKASLVELIQQLSKKFGKNSVVLLVDEYDKPILNHIHNIEQAQKNREVMSGFYDTIKGLDEHLRAVFITGVTKFVKTSIFSGLNNLDDISLDQKYSALLGYTDQEIKDNFSEFINNIANKKNSDSKYIVDSMRLWYNGYRFSKDKTKVYNPFSILYYLKNEEFRNYWFESGTPTFLAYLVQNQFYTLHDFKLTEINLSSLGSFSIDNIPFIPLLFQTGYLTISDYNESTNKYLLDYPNLEVEESFDKFVLESIANVKPYDVDNYLTKIVSALENNKIQDFCHILEVLFAQIPYTLFNASESDYHTLLQFLMSLLNVDTRLEAMSEILTNQGRIDLVIKTKEYIYIFEVKINKKPIRALQQIDDREYYKRYQLDNRKIVLTGLSFNVENKKLKIECESRNL